ncbi:nucleoside-diphosphate sugar epimerase/dehydratase [Acidisphaera sp. L21]|uniref:nucleoside-diphosphate sugar epimerase/dehydratase n=1 Tax=Acidisphaera sp. L21 TaxID=1641851 RepID=UPI00131B0CD6|nr:nucleoside-diphosphate sugar epimerase/dehydratase [Acidisphaera sp. L21]
MASQRSAFRILMNVSFDGALAAVAAVVARWVADPGGGLLHPLWFLGGGAITLLVGGLPFHLSQQYWRFSGVEDLVGVAGSSIVSAALFALVWTVTGYPLPTLTFPIVHALTLATFLGAPRVFYRLTKTRPRRAKTPEVQNVLLVGAGEGADSFLRALAGERRATLRVIGLLALGRNQTGRRMQGRPILGGVSELRRVLDRLGEQDRLPDALVVTEPKLAGSRMAYLLEEAQRQNIPVRQAPRPTELREAGAIELKPVALEDLLNRPQVRLDRDGMARLVRGRRVLVTGAGGTIGSELARQLAALEPAALTILDSGEFALWQIDLELGETHPALPRHPVIADVRDEARIVAAFAAARPELVFHAAALKHVPMVEANPGEGLLTNAGGTRVVVDAAAACGAAATVLISTDKAVNPSSLMGASKRMAEMYCQALDDQARRRGGMRCITVRFGNVLGSTGSVVPLFRRQLARGGPLTVTHPDMQRYFMTVREAVSLVLQASVVGMEEGAPDGGIFVLDMGKPVKIVDLARQMIRLAGLRPDLDVPIHFTGLRPGEKLFEELFHGEEPPMPTGHPGLLMATPRTADAAIVRRAIAEIAAACHAGQVDAAIAVLGSMVPEFQHMTGEPIAQPLRSPA